MALKYSSNTAILEDTFSSFPAASISCKLTLTENILYIDFLSKTKPEVEEIYLSDMIGCKVLKNKNKNKSEDKDICAYLTVNSYPLKTFAGILSKQLRRERRILTFQMCKFDTLDDNLKLVNRWQIALSCLIRGVSFYRNGDVHIPRISPPPRKVLILINPKSGPGKAPQVFKERVVPLLAESDTIYDLLITDRANCARDYVKKADISQWDGIVVVSGDGLLFEVYNGLMARPDWKEAVKKPVGVIPGGSGNGLARALSHAAGEPYDVTVVIPSVLNAVHGRVVPMDLVKVTTEKGCFYSFLSVGWGLMADIDIESERLRAIGEARFAVWGVIRALGLRRYKGRLSYLPVSGYDATQQIKNVSEPRPKRSKTIDCHLAWSEDPTLPKDGVDEHSIFRSKSFGTQDPQLDDERDVRLLKYSYSGEELDSPSYGTPYIKSLTNRSDIKDGVPHDHCLEDAEGSNEEPIEGTGDSFCPPLSSPVPEDWVVIDDEFVLAYACHQTHLSTDVFFAPKAKMDDGIMWLVMIRGNVSRAQVMYFLASLQSGDHVHNSCVDVIPIHAFRLEPYTTDGFITVDGEVIPVCSIQAEVLPSIARVMSR